MNAQFAKEIADEIGAQLGQALRGAVVDAMQRLPDLPAVQERDFLRFSEEHSAMSRPEARQFFSRLTPQDRKALVNDIRRAKPGSVPDATEIYRFEPALRKAGADVNELYRTLAAADPEERRAVLLSFAEAERE